MIASATMTRFIPCGIAPFLVWTIYWFAVAHIAQQIEDSDIRIPGIIWWGASALAGLIAGKGVISSAKKILTHDPNSHHHPLAIYGWAFIGFVLGDFLAHVLIVLPRHTLNFIDHIDFYAQVVVAGNFTDFFLRAIFLFVTAKVTINGLTPPTTIRP